jgi:HSP20 family protein
MSARTAGDEANRQRFGERIGEISDMVFIRWDPLKELMEFQERMDSLFDSTLARTRREEVLKRSTWTPSVDIYETGDEIVVDVELAEIDVDDLVVDVERGVLTIKGERSLSKETKAGQYHLVERSYGPFSRSFALPESVDPGGVKGNYKNGILTLKLPKKGEPKRIVIENL